MKRPDSAAVIVAVFLLADAGIALLCGAPWVAIVLTLMACGALGLFWRVPLLDENGDDIEALIEATREDMPEFVPAEWVKEYRQ